MAEAEIVSFAERLKARRQELGLSQAQAARELDVARTAYRLWEMEAAKPQPDRWRLISRWLGVSVTTMLLADELDHEPGTAAPVPAAFAGLALEDRPTSPAAFFQAAQELIQDGVEKGFLSTEHADELTSTLEQAQQEQGGDASEAWEPARLYKEFKADTHAPRAAREALAFVASDLPTSVHTVAQLLVSELVTNSVRYGPERNGKVGVLVDVARERLRVEVTDTAKAAPEPIAPSESGGYGLVLVVRLASRWSTERDKRGNVTWFELDLVPPGAKPDRDRPSGTAV
jgi:transcriptional regulator with XRE-family HTH domain/anti-sigma regulatory factor (Ser/Thr protein kinase)